MAAFTQKSITDYKAERAQQVRPATVNRELALLKTMFNKAIAWGIVDRNPVRGVELFTEDNQVERILTEEEEEQLFAACVNRLPYVRAVFIGALHTGMRQGELLSLKWSNVSLPFGQIVVEAMTAKGKRRRSIPINDTVRAMLEQRKISATGEYVFGRPDGRRYNRSTIDEHFEKACEAAGIKGLRFHDLRHTFATRLSACGVDLVTIKDLLGHASISTTLRYAHSRSHRQAVALLDKSSLRETMTKV